jgi:hypothetical protein
MLDPRAAYCFKDFLSSENFDVLSLKHFLENHFNISTEIESIEKLKWNVPIPIGEHNDFVSIVYLNSFEEGGTISTKNEIVKPEKNMMCFINVKRLTSDDSFLEKGPGEYILILWKNTRENE